MSTIIITGASRGLGKELALLFAEKGWDLILAARDHSKLTVLKNQIIREFDVKCTIIAGDIVNKETINEIAKSVPNNKVDVLINNAGRYLKKPFTDTDICDIEDVLNIKLLAVTYFGSRQVNLRQPKSELTVSTPADLAGVNLRMPGTAAWQFLGNALGANATPLAFSEVYTSLASGAVDGQDNPLPTVVDKKLYEVTKQIILTSHLADLNYIAISKSVWDDMTYDQKRAVHNAAEAAADHSTAAVQAKEASLVSFLESEGLDVYEPDLDAFRNHVQGLYMDSEFAKTWPEGLLDKINAL